MVRRGIEAASLEDAMDFPQNFPAVKWNYKPGLFVE
jgi:hypothetical protein